ncbi:hypothetical protein [Methylocella sp.]|uniref:hypothetical protein n=1 Tax=Methylocella sp. TaxID=1978226 RepID=UPI003C27B55F
MQVIPVTAAPAGWCDQMARMWPVDGVIGENGGLFFRREADGHGVERMFWHPDENRLLAADRLAAIANHVQKAVPDAVCAEDQPFRLTSVAFVQPDDPKTRAAIITALDAPMFGFFRHTVGVSTVTRYLSSIPLAPRWIAADPGGAGFVEAADAVIASR